ncbi:MAG: DUF6496 domain-containing protein [Acidobacteriia bacterium]|nr:DUF6496 domain-containing protein [Terriglobia bacterium]
MSIPSGIAATIRNSSWFTASSGARPNSPNGRIGCARAGAVSGRQAIAIGLSKARRAGVPLPPPKEGKTSERTRVQAQRDLAKGRSGPKKPSAKRSRAVKGELKREGRSAASPQALSRQARSAAAARKKGA